MRVRLLSAMALTRSAVKRWSSAPPLLQHNGFHASPCGRESGDFLFISENGLKYRVREANKQDIASLNACNRQNLPENYNDEFYENQLTRWSSISLIAENEKEVIGYSLGRIETVEEKSIHSGSVAGHFFSSHEYPRVPSFQGHTVSIAVNPAYRGHDVAFNMMQILHHRFAVEYSVDTSTLYCRPSNKSAMILYSNKLGYVVDSVIPRYYTDSEDACFMKVTGLLMKYN